MTTQELIKEIQKLIAEGGRYHIQGRHALSLQCYQKAIGLSAPLNDRALDAFLLARTASEHRDCDNYHHAVELLIQALVLVQNEDELIELRTDIKKLLAITLKDIFGPQKPEVLELLKEARENCIKMGDLGAEANVLLHIGGTYLELNRLDDADRILTEALEKSREVNDIQHQGWILINMADVEIERGEWGLALDYIRNAQEKVRDVQDSEAEGNTWVTEARILFRMGQLEEALTAAQTALRIYTQNKNQRRSIRARRHIAKLLVELGQLDEAVKELHEAIKTATFLDLRNDLVLLNIQLGSLELGRKNYDIALKCGYRAREIAEAENSGYLISEIDSLIAASLPTNKKQNEI